MTTKDNRHSIHVSLRKDNDFENKLAEAFKRLPHGWAKLVVVKLCRSILGEDSTIGQMRDHMERLCAGPINFAPAENMVLPSAPHRPFMMQERVESAKAPVDQDVSRETYAARRERAIGGELGGMIG